MALRGLNSFSHCLHRGHLRDEAKLFRVLHNGRRRDNGQKLKQEKFGLDLRRKFSFGGY